MKKGLVFTKTYEFRATANWITDSLKEFVANKTSARVKINREGSGGSAVVSAPTQDVLNDAVRLIAAHTIFKDHFTET